MYPPVLGYGDQKTESFDDYYARWPSELSSIPQQVVQDWIYRHWSCFNSYWAATKPHLWAYRLEAFTNAKILTIQHPEGWTQSLEDESAEYVAGKPRSHAPFAKYLLTNGTFPLPILVAEDAGHVRHPRLRGEVMKEPYQIIEGHRRLICIRGMINSKHPALKGEHSVWVATIPRSACAA